MRSLYPKDEDYVPNPRNQNKQLTLPLDPTAQRLQQVSLAHGDNTVYSTEELMSGTEEFYSLEFGLIHLPSPFIALLKSFHNSRNLLKLKQQVQNILSSRRVSN